MPETWLQCAVQRYGPSQKQGYPSVPDRAVTDIQGVLGHSMEGHLMAALAELDRLDRRASWTFSNPKSGKLIAHYPLEAITWHGGSVQANRLFVGVEHEGVAGELINANQRQNLADLLGELGKLIPVSQWVRNVNLYEHREMVAFGASPTACPSNRIPWAQVLELIKEDDMALSPAATQGIEDFYGKAWTDKAGNTWPNVATFVTLTLQDLRYDAGTIPQGIADALAEISALLQNPPLADIAKAVNDDAAARLKT